MKQARHLIIVFLLILAVSGGYKNLGSQLPQLPGERSTATVARIVDGDTIKLTDGQTVRLVQIDTPEKFRTPECFGKNATAMLARMIPVGSKVILESDPAADDVDQYGRKLAYVFFNKRNINVAMVRQGGATPYFYQGQMGKYSPKLKQAMQMAKNEKRGMWGHCPVRYVEGQGASTGPSPKP